jgi:hypothetical protein
LDCVAVAVPFSPSSITSSFPVLLTRVSNSNVGEGSNAIIACKLCVHLVIYIYEIVRLMTTATTYKSAMMCSELYMTI